MFSMTFKPLVSATGWVIAAWIVPLVVWEAIGCLDVCSFRKSAISWSVQLNELENMRFHNLTLVKCSGRVVCNITEICSAISFWEPEDVCFALVL